MFASLSTGLFATVLSRTLTQYSATFSMCTNWRRAYWVHLKTRSKPRKRMKRLWLDCASKNLQRSTSTCCHAVVLIARIWVLPSVRPSVRLSVLYVLLTKCSYATDIYKTHC